MPPCWRSISKTGPQRKRSNPRRWSRRRDCWRCWTRRRRFRCSSSSTQTPWRRAEARTFGDKPQITDFNDYEIRIEEVFRFNPEDTLVFHVTLRNKSDQEIRYLPDSFCVRVGNRLYHQSISDAPGVLPPKAASTVYFAITGTPDGGRNELSLKNEFSVLVDAGVASAHLARLLPWVA